MNPQVSDEWLVMALDVVHAAEDRMTVQEFDRRSKLLPHAAGAGYLDRMRVLDELIAMQVVGLDNRHLVTGRIDEVDWVLSGLQSGNELTWRIAEIVDRRGLVIRKFDSESLVEIGLIGERAVVSQLQEQLGDHEAHRVRHVSLVDDSLGYDVASPSVGGREITQLLEVKTTVRPGRDFNFYLSRNEFRVGMNNSNWSLVCVQVVDNLPSILGHLQMAAIADCFPLDQHESVKWASCRVAIPRDVLNPGLP